MSRVRFPMEEGRANVEVALEGIPAGDERYTWSPEHPNLFSVDIRLFAGGVLTDETKTRFGLRKIERRGDEVFLNGKPFYQRLILDQGYWRESGITPPECGGAPPR